MKTPFSPSEGAEAVFYAMDMGIPAPEAFLALYQDVSYMDGAKVTAWLARYQKTSKSQQTSGIVIGAFILLGLYVQTFPLTYDTKESLYHQAVAAFLLDFENQGLSTEKAPCPWEDNSNLPPEKVLSKEFIKAAIITLENCLKKLDEWRQQGKER